MQHSIYASVYHGDSWIVLIGKHVGMVQGILFSVSD